jgi:hypothetical protein
MYSVQDFRKETSRQMTGDVWNWRLSTTDAPNGILGIWNFMRWQFNSDIVAGGQEPGGVSTSSRWYFDMPVSYIKDPDKYDWITTSAPDYEWVGFNDADTITFRAKAYVSSIRFKKDVEYSAVVPDFRGVHSCTFRYKEGTYTGLNKECGLIAEDLDGKDGLADTLTHDGDISTSPIRAIRWNSLTAKNSHAIGAMQQTIDDLLAAVAALTLRVAALESP